MKYLQMIWDFLCTYPEVLYVLVAFTMGKLGTMPDWAYLMIYLLYVGVAFISYVGLPDKPEITKE